MQRISETVEQKFAEVYQQIQQELDNEFEIDCVYNNNQLEGSYFPKWATEKILKGIPIKRKNRFKANDILAAQQQFKAIKFIRDMASILNYEISEADVKHIHCMISQHLANSNPGQYRTTDIDCTIPPSEIPQAMSELINFINGGAFKFRPIERAACIHYRLLRILPFASCNGSVARLLMNFVLIKNGYPLLVISVTNKKEYLESLDKDDSIHFLQFITSHVAATINAYSFRTKERLEINIIKNTDIQGDHVLPCFRCRDLTDNNVTAKHLQELHMQIKRLEKRLESITVTLRRTHFHH